MSIPASRRRLSDWRPSSDGTEFSKFAQAHPEVQVLGVVVDTGDVAKLTDDPRFMDSIRSVAEGLGKFFDELYPAQTKAGPTPR